MSQQKLSLEKAEQHATHTQQSNTPPSFEQARVFEQDMAQWEEPGGAQMDAGEDGQEVVLVSSSFDYSQLDPETRQFVEHQAIQTHGLLKRTAEHILSIGNNLLAVKERLPHGHFLPWLKAEFGMSRHTARHFMQVAVRLTGKWRNFHHLPVSVLYELASPSTPDHLMEQVESGEQEATLQAIREAKAALKQAALATAAEQAARALTQEAQARTLAVQKEAQAQAEQIKDFTHQIEELHQQIATLTERERVEERVIETVVEKAVIPPEVLSRLERLGQQVSTLTAERDALGERVEQFGAHNRAEFFARNEVARDHRVRQQWRTVTQAWQKGSRELYAHWPTLLDTESFGQEEWAALTHIKEAAQEIVLRYEKLMQAREMIVDSR